MVVLLTLIVNIFIDDLSGDQNIMKVGCHFIQTYESHLIYAGDIILLKVSTSALQCVIKCSAIST